MIIKEDKIHYSRNFKIGLIISLLFAVISFMYFPDIEYNSSETPTYYEPIITLMDIPMTSNSGKPESVPPEPVVIVTPNIIEAQELIEVPDVEIKENNLNESSNNNLRNNTTADNKGVYEFSALPFIPRQVLEVVPKEISGAKGQIVISLRIDKNGNVKEHKIIKDNSNKNECIKNVIAAVYKSRWQPIIIEGDRIEYWVEKVYVFN